MADTATVLNSLPEPLQLALSVGTGIAALGAAIYRIAAKPKGAPDAEVKPAAEEAKAVVTAFIAPSSGPNQLRQAVEELHRLNDDACQLVGLADDVKDGLPDLKDGHRDLRDAISRRRPADARMALRLRCPRFGGWARMRCTLFGAWVISRAGEPRACASAVSPPAD